MNDEIKKTLTKTLGASFKGYGSAERSRSGIVLADVPMASATAVFMGGNHCGAIRTGDDGEFIAVDPDLTAIGTFADPVQAVLAVLFEAA